MPLELFTGGGEAIFTGIVPTAPRTKGCSMLLPILGAALPAALWLVLFYRSDRYSPEPKKLVARTFLIGAVVGAAIAFSLKGMPFKVGVLFAPVFLAPVLEETAKFLCVRWTVYHRSEFDEPVDGIVYATAAALGFAMTENILYVLEGWTAGGAALGSYILAGRAVLSVPAHAVFSSMWGFALGWSKGRKGLKPVLMVSAGLIASMVLHGLFNYLTGENLFGGLVFMVFLAAAWRLTYLLTRKALKASAPPGDDGISPA